MFKDARALDRQRTATSFDRALATYTKVAESWFDGTVQSVDRRLAQCDRLLHTARAEWQASNDVVTEWELRRNFERI